MTGSMRTLLVVAAGGFVLTNAQPAGTQSMRTGPAVILAFGTMYGVDEAFVGEANPIRGVVGDELPWQVESARGRLDASGHLKLRVRGLVFTDDDAVPPDLRLTNDETEFRALVSCLSENGAGGVTERNVTTRAFPATPAGDFRINARLTLPDPCVAPIVFVLSGSEDKWFAVTGFESGSGNDQGGQPSPQPTTTSTSQSEGTFPSTLSTFPPTLQTFPPPLPTITPTLPTIPPPTFGPPLPTFPPPTFFPTPTSFPGTPPSFPQTPPSFPQTPPSFPQTPPSFPTFN